MIPAAFEYKRAGSVDEALSLLREYGDDAKVLAGGHSLLPLMKLRLATPSVLVDVGRIGELSYISLDGNEVAIGAHSRHRDLQTSELLISWVPILAHVAGLIGDPQVRHRGTIGGSLSHGDPASDLPAVILALGGTLVVRSAARGERRIEAGNFWRGFLETALEPDELLCEIRVPVSEGAFSFQKFNRRAQDWAIVGVAAQANHSVAVSLVNMAATPVRARAVEEALSQGASPADAASLAAVDLDPPSDINGSSEYRRHLATVLVRRSLEEILGG